MTRIECVNFKSHNSGALQGFATLFVEKMGIEIKDCCLFMKDGKRWMTFPSREFTNDKGEKKYAPLIKFREKGLQEQFMSLAINAVDEYALEQKSKSALADGFDLF